MSNINLDKQLTEDEAAKFIYCMIYGVQKVRSIIAEGISGYGGTTEVEKRVLENINHWVWAKDCPLLRALVDTADTWESNGYIEPLRIYNFIIILDKIPPVYFAMIVNGVTPPSLRTASLMLRTGFKPGEGEEEERIPGMAPAGWIARAGRVAAKDFKNEREA